MIEKLCLGTRPFLALCLRRIIGLQRRKGEPTVVQTNDQSAHNSEPGQEVVVNLPSYTGEGAMYDTPPLDESRETTALVRRNAPVNMWQWMIPLYALLAILIASVWFNLSQTAKESTLQETTKTFAETQSALLNSQSDITQQVKNVTEKMSTLDTNVRTTNQALTQVKSAMGDLKGAVETNYSELGDKFKKDLTIRQRNRRALHRMEEKLNKILKEPITVKFKVAPPSKKADRR